MTEAESIRWEAAQWVERCMDGPPDQQALDAWLAGDPRRQPVFEAMRERLMGSGMDAALRAYGRRGKSFGAAAGGGLAVLLVAIGGYSAMPAVELSFARPQSYAVSQGDVRNVALADGSKVTLARGAEIKVRYTRHARLVELTQGTIFAEVAHDERRPFRIETGNAEIVDVGTSFEVSSRPGEVHVAVASGGVRFGRDGWFDKPITLLPRQAATLEGTVLRRNADAEPGTIARWRSEWMEYRGAPLRQVVSDLQSLSPYPIEISDSALAERRVSGRIRLTDPLEQLQNLAIVYDLKVERRGDLLVLSHN